MDTKVFTTEKVARILDLPEWRVVRFAQGKKYGITPAFGQAAGSGTRRLYDLENVCEMAVASSLTKAGLRIEVIARVLTQVRKQGGLSHLLNLPGAKLLDLFLGVIRARRGNSTSQEAVYLQNWEQLQNIFRKNQDASVLIVPLGIIFMLVKHFLEELDEEEKKAKGA